MVIPDPCAWAQQLAALVYDDHHAGSSFVDRAVQLGDVIAFALAAMILLAILLVISLFVLWVIDRVTMLLRRLFSCPTATAQTGQLAAAIQAELEKMGCGSRTAAEAAIPSEGDADTAPPSSTAGTTDTHPHTCRPAVCAQEEGSMEMDSGEAVEKMDEADAEGDETEEEASEEEEAPEEPAEQQEEETAGGQAGELGIFGPLRQRRKNPRVTFQ